MASETDWSVYDHAKVTELVDELHQMKQDDADELAGEIRREICGDFRPYSDGDDVADGHIDLLKKADDMVARWNA